MEEQNGWKNIKDYGNENPYKIRTAMAPQP